MCSAESFQIAACCNCWYAVCGRYKAARRNERCSLKESHPGGPTPDLFACWFAPAVLKRKYRCIQSLLKHCLQQGLLCFGRVRQIHGIMEQRAARVFCCIHRSTARDGEWW